MLAKGWATDGVSGGGALASNKVNTLAKAFIDFTGASQATVEAGGDVTVSASDAAGIESHSSVIQSAIVSNTGAGSAQFVSDLLPRDNDYTTKSGLSEVTPGTRVRIAADDSALGVSATSTSTRARRRCSTSARGELQDRPALWTDLSVQPHRRRLLSEHRQPDAVDARAVGILVVMNDLRAASQASIDNAHVTADSVTVSADETAQLQSEATTTVTASGGSFKGGGTVQAINGQVVTNVVLASATASIADSREAGGDVTVVAVNHAGIDATLLVATNSGDTAVAITLAFNSLGWKSQNILFNLVDAILGSPIIAARQRRAALVRQRDDRELDDRGRRQRDRVRRGLRAAERDRLERCRLDRLGALQRDRQGARHRHRAEQGLDKHARVDHRRHLERRRRARASPASDEAGIFSNVKIVSSSSHDERRRHEGAPGRDQQLPRRAIRLHGRRAEPKLGDRVRILADQATADVKKGAVYEWMGEDSAAI